MTPRRPPPEKAGGRMGSPLQFDGLGRDPGAGRAARAEFWRSPVGVWSVRIAWVLGLAALIGWALPAPKPGAETLWTSWRPLLIALALVANWVLVARLPRRVQIAVVWAELFVLLIAFFVVVVQLSDVLQYVWGKLAGHRPIAPTLSPSKTVEGFLGGVLSASAIGAGRWWMTPFGIGQAALMALAITLMGFVGGLVMSAIKRDRGIKDWGHVIAGHGGFIDRLDSVFFAAPIFFHLTRYFWAVG